MSLNNCSSPQLRDGDTIYNPLLDLQGMGGNQANALSWEETSSGPPHAKIWTLVCKSNWWT